MLGIAPVLPLCLPFFLLRHSPTMSANSSVTSVSSLSTQEEDADGDKRPSIQHRRANKPTHGRSTAFGPTHPIRGRNTASATPNNPQQKPFAVGRAPGGFEPPPCNKHHQPTARPSTLPNTLPDASRFSRTGSVGSALSLAQPWRRDNERRQHEAAAAVHRRR